MCAILNHKQHQLLGVLYHNGGPYSVAVRTHAGLICHLNASVLKPMAP
jgi:hypothetical protein